MGSTIQGISRPYVGQNARSIDDIKQVTDKKPGDVTSPATPQLIRAWAFELTADGSTAVPPLSVRTKSEGLPRDLFAGRAASSSAAAAVACTWILEA